jgi:LacI family transcriptional regulator
MERLLKLIPRPDAVFCYDDHVAIGAMNAIIAAELRIPDDIGLVGVGNIRYAKSLRVPLSSIDISFSALGELAGLLATRVLAQKRAVRPKMILIQPKLIARESTGYRQE